MKKRKIVVVILFIGMSLSFTIAMQWSDAAYPGGREAMENYFEDSMRYPQAELLLGREEIVYVRFEVSETGVAENPQPTSLIGGSSAFNEEAKRLINAMPKWDPELNKRGKPETSFQYAIVRFVLPDSLIQKYPLTADTSKYKIPPTGEVMPRFQGDEAGFQNYLKWTIRYPEMEKEEGRDGTVYIYFEVTPYGAIENVKCVKGVPGAPGLEKEAIRVVSEMPRWVPGYIDGRPVKVSMTVPVRFTLQ